MAIGERIHFFRLLRGMTQKYLGMALGFPEKSADVRHAEIFLSHPPQETEKVNPFANRHIIHSNRWLFLGKA